MANRSLSDVRVRKRLLIMCIRLVVASMCGEFDPVIRDELLDLCDLSSNQVHGLFKYYSSENHLAGLCILSLLCYNKTTWRFFSETLSN